MTAETGAEKAVKPNTDKIESSDRQPSSTLAGDQWHQMRGMPSPDLNQNQRDTKGIKGAQSLTFDNSIYSIDNAGANSGSKPGGNTARDLSQQMSGIDNSDPRDKSLDKAGISNTENVLTSGKYSSGDMLRAADMLQHNGINQVHGANGETYQIKGGGSTRSLNGDNSLKLEMVSNDGTIKTLASGTVDALGELKTLNGNGMGTRGIHIDNADNKQVINDKQQGQKIDAGADTKTVPKPDGGDQTPATKPILDPNLSVEDKLKEADKMYQRGERHFTGPNGEKYDISESNVGGRKVISVHLNDGHGSHPVLRGVIEKDGTVGKQKDSKGREVDHVSDWGKKHGADTGILKKPEPKPEPQPEPKPNPEPKPDGGDHKGDGQDKPSDQTKEQKDLDAERERLKHNAEKIEDPERRQQFLKDMESFEKRAKEQHLATPEVTETYKQMSRLLEAENGAVGKKERQLAAESFMSHAADPTNIDQGYHNTCNVTTIAERTTTRHPSKTAEMVASTALDGKWTAPDGKVITIDKNSLQPGREEGTFPPARDGDRSYATQLMNLAMVNDALQRKMPPEFYGQGRPTATNPTGETVQYEDGKPKGDGSYHGIHLGPMTDIERRLTGEDHFGITSKSIFEQEGVDRVGSPEELKTRLRELKEQGKLPAVIQVDVNDPVFGGTGDAKTKGKWHVVSITDYDPNTGEVSISNQWGKKNDKTAKVDDVYRSMT